MQLLDQYDRGVRAADQARMRSSEAADKWSAVVAALKFGRLRVLCDHTASVARRALRRVQNGLRVCLAAGFSAASAACPVMGQLPGSIASVAGKSRARAAASGAGSSGSGESKEQEDELVLPPLARDVVCKLAEAVSAFDQARRVAAEALALAQHDSDGVATSADGGAASGSGSAVSGEARWAKNEDSALRAERCSALALSFEVHATVSASSLPTGRSLGVDGSIAQAAGLHRMAMHLADEHMKRQAETEGGADTEGDDATMHLKDVILASSCGVSRCGALAKAHEAAAALADADAALLLLPEGSRRVAPYNVLDSMAPGADVLPGDAAEALVAAATLSLSLDKVPIAGKMPTLPITNWEKPEAPLILPKPLHFDVAFEYTSPPVDALAERAGMDEEEEEEEEETVGGSAAGGSAQEEGGGMLGGFVKMFTG